MSTCQLYAAVRLSIGYQFIDSATSDDHSVEEKLDLLLKSVPTLSNKQDALANRHDASQRELNSNEDVTTAQEDATERVLKRSKRDRSYEFKQKGHKEQFNFNEGVEDRIDVAAKRIKRLAPSEGDRKTIQEAIDELQEGMDAFAKRQKHICIADTLRFHWQTVDRLKFRNSDISEEEKRWIKEAERGLAEEYGDGKRVENISRLHHNYSNPCFFHRGNHH